MRQYLPPFNPCVFFLFFIFFNKSKSQMSFSLLFKKKIKKNAGVEGDRYCLLFFKKKIQKKMATYAVSSFSFQTQSTTASDFMFYGNGMPGSSLSINNQTFGLTGVGGFDPNGQSVDIGVPTPSINANGMTVYPINAISSGNVNNEQNPGLTLSLRSSTAGTFSCVDRSTQLTLAIQTKLSLHIKVTL